MFMCEFVVFIALMVLFAVLFGRPSVSNYLKNDTFTTETGVQFKPEDSPAITVYALNPKQGTGWKKIVNYNQHFK
jgi:hypothetical protein